MQSYGGPSVQIILGRPKRKDNASSLTGPASKSAEAKGSAPQSLPPQAHSPLLSEDKHQRRLRQRLDRKQAAEFLTAQGFKITPNRLAKMAAAHEGPVYHKWGKTVYYYPDDLMQWAQARLVVVRPKK
jgi:hypothetical protein